MMVHITLKALVGISLHGATAFITPRCGGRRSTTVIVTVLQNQISLPEETPPDVASRCAWSPQDLTKDNPGFPPIPDDDYVKKYQRNTDLWPVEFFAIAHRRRMNGGTGRLETQVLVRKSANGTSKYGLGTGVPATRWVPSSSQEAEPPAGYIFAEPRITFDARNYPEFPSDGVESWTYTKINIREDAFAASTEFHDAELENYATKIRDQLRKHLSNKMQDADRLSSWELSTNAIARTVVGDPNSVTAIQGALRMSGLFAKTKKEKQTNEDGSSPCHRYVSFEDAPRPTELVESTRVYTMFPQMPDPMPLPSTSAKDLQREIASRQSLMADSGRDPHKDKYGRVFTHISTSNVSNTIQGVYFTFDVTDLSGLEKVPALDLLSAREVEREWVSLSDLNVLEKDGKTISTVDTKPTFISGFILRQLVKEGVIAV